MALYARRGDMARHMRGTAESLRWMRTRRPLRGHVPSPTWVMEGTITLDRFFPPALITIDPIGEGDYPEYKRIVGFDAWLQTGAVEINWLGNDGYILLGHAIAGGSNRVMLDEPFIIEAVTPVFGEYISPEIQSATGAANLSCVALVEVVPV